MKNVYTVYQIKNLVNDKIYIGVHKCESYNLLDDYLGSGPIVKAAKEKYGKHNLAKSIIAEFDNEDDAYALEAKLVDNEFITRTDTYNLTPGGKGGWDYVNSLNLPNAMHNPVVAKKVSDSIKYTRAQNPDYYNKISIDNFKIASIKNTGTKHSVETCQKRSQSLIEHYKNNESVLKNGTISDDHKQKCSDAWTPEMRAAKSEFMKERVAKNPDIVKTRLGHKNSDEHNQAISDARKEYWKQAKEVKAVCPHCGKEGILAGMKRWHFDNCRNK